jgi:hypothetical protein
LLSSKSSVVLGIASKNSGLRYLSIHRNIQSHSVRSVYASQNERNAVESIVDSDSNAEVAEA